MILNFDQNTTENLQKIHPLISKIITHPLFQRLKSISQTASTEFFFQNQKEHNRFNHSIGTLWEISDVLSRKNFQHIKFDQDEDLKALIMGLCHDLGHGPYSHIFEDIILPEIGITNFCHEKQSVEICQQIFKGELNFEKEEMKEILLNGGKNFSNEIFHLVSNKRFGIDCDRIDYLQRDSIFQNIQSWVNFDQLKDSLVLTPCSLVPNKKYVLTIHQNGLSQFHAFLNFRYWMFQHIYLHPRAMGFHYFIQKILVTGVDLIDIKKMVINLKDFTKLTDQIVFQILELFKKNNQHQNLVERFQKKNFYYFCGRVYFQNQHDQLRSKWENEMKQQFEDIIVSNIVNKNFKDVNFEETIICEDLNSQKFSFYNDFVKTNKIQYFQKQEENYADVFCFFKKDVEKVKRKIQHYFDNNSNFEIQYEFDTLNKLDEEININRNKQF